MSTTKYEVFLKSAQLGNFTRAAEELNITQSGVSHTVAALEKELGLNLLIRSKGGVTLTADGAALLPRVQAVCEEERRLQEKAQELRGLEAGTIRIASFNSVAVKWLPKILKGFCDLHPGVEFRLIMTDDDRQTEQMVMNGFTTRFDRAADPTLIEEGIVARPVIPICDGRGNRIIVKVKYCDYIEYKRVRDEFTDREFEEFTEWYNSLESE